MRRVMKLMMVVALVGGATAGAGEVDWERVRNPQTAAGRGPQTVAELRERFANPPEDYRPMPLWVWNDAMRWERMAQQLRDFARLGFGGAFIHPRPGLETEYLSEEWFELWRKALEEGKRWGLRMQIYDENSYPSGFAGGHVPARDPETQGRVMTVNVVRGGQGLAFGEAATVAVYAVEGNGKGEVARFRRIVSREELAPERDAVVMQIRRTEARPFTAGFAYVDLTDPRTTPLFLETTYEAYRQRVGEEFGRTILMAFSDEPELPAHQARATTMLGMSLHTLEEFRRRRGYDLRDHLPSLFWDAGEWRKVRFDYWETQHDLLVENFFAKMFSWCDRHRLQWTGHWWEHLWPYPYTTPAEMSYYAFQHVPGIDILWTPNLHRCGQEPLLLLTVKAAASAARQLGRTRVLSESYGGSGWDAGLEAFKRIGDWQMVHGVNLVNQHLTHTTVRGGRKRDWPQSFSDHAAWWPYYRMHADYLARMSLALTAGQARHRALVLLPTTTGFLYARRGEAEPAELEEIRRKTAGLVQDLADRQVDFDLGDEYLLEWLGRAEKGKLVLGRVSYELVVYPERMENLRGATVRLLEAYLRSGGRVLALGEPARYVDGRESGAVAELATRYAKQWQRAPHLIGLVGAMREMLPPRIVFRPGVPVGVGVAERFLEGGERLLLLVNSGNEGVRTTAEVEGVSVEEWDLEKGEVRGYPYQNVEKGRVRFPVVLGRAGSLLVRVSRGATTQAGKEVGTMRWESVEEGLWEVARETENVLVVDYCDVEAGGERLREAPALVAARHIFRAHGFLSNPWEGTVQFRRNWLDRNEFPAGSGFQAVCRFQIEGAVPAALALVVERGELYRVKVNGREVRFSEGEWWLEEVFRRAEISRLAQEGENVIEVEGRPFDIHMEWEPLYVVGDFGVEARARGFAVTAGRKLGLGAWREQGMPFYGGTVLYRRQVATGEAVQRVRVELPEVEGAVVEFLIDGKPVEARGWEPYRMEAPVSAGKHEIVVRVVGTPRNVFGPFHDAAKRRLAALPPGAWLSQTPRNEPRGADYDLVDYGLKAAPRVELGRPD